MARRTREEYEAMTRDYETSPPVADEIVSVSPGGLPMGRPRKGAGTGKTPSMSVRFPAEMRGRLARQAEAELVVEAEIVRRAVDEYLARRGA